jgi:aryl-alcohol dehydrogenase-like predicted oxidoreductase
VTSVLAGASRPDQIVQSARAGSLKLSKDVLDELDVATRQVKQKMGANPDMWQGKAGSRVR